MNGRTPIKAFKGGLKQDRSTAPYKPKGETLTNKPGQDSMQTQTSAA